MKKLILGMMLLVGSLSFSSQDDRGIDSHNFDQTIVTQVNQNNDVSFLKDRVLFGMSSENRN